MKKLAAPLLILFFIVLNLLSCDGLDENYSNNPNHRLSFSVRHTFFRYGIHHNRLRNQRVHDL